MFYYSLALNQGMCLCCDGMPDEYLILNSGTFHPQDLIDLHTVRFGGLLLILCCDDLRYCGTVYQMTGYISVFYLLFFLPVTLQVPLYLLLFLSLCLVLQLQQALFCYLFSYLWCSSWNLLGYDLMLYTLSCIQLVARL